MRHLNLVLGATALLFTTPAFADAVTYKGTLGTIPIVAEITEAANGPIVGRYFYTSKGGDIPLQAQPGAGNKIILAEEATCTEQLCDASQDYPRTKFPIGAIWTLERSADGATVSGQWRLLGKEKPLAVTLTRVGSRVLAEGAITPSDLKDFSDSLSYDHAISLSMADAPYEFLKVQGPLKPGAKTSINGSTYQMVSDPRSGFEFPRIVKLADGSDPAAANAWLQDRHWHESLEAMSCLSTAYLGMGWMYGEGGGLGEYDYVSHDVTYLSSKIMSWTEGGSVYCFGAHPDNFYDSYNLDIAAGKILALEAIFKDWVAKSYGADEGDAPIGPATAHADPDQYYFGPGKDMVAYVIAHRETDAERDEECGILDLIPTNLAIHFVDDNRVSFGLEGLPYAIQACGDEQLNVPIKDLKPLLAPGAKDYFASLK
ncbi:hypothetical protein [Devosia sp.]|uniref:hypothetical protein n=1 Tax=Devosia sp. TaxID=1871048 RepID=UPI003267659C